MLRRILVTGVISAAVSAGRPDISAAQDVQTRFGGRVQNDWAWFIQNDASETAIGDVLDGTEFRRARIYASGTIYNDVDFKVQYDFAGGDADFKDVWIGLRGIPGIQSLKFGHHKEPFSLEEQTSSKYLSFLERSLPSVFSPSRNTGVSARNAPLNGRLTWAVGVFRDTDGFGDGVADGGYNVTGRVTGLPWTSDDGSGLLHLGVAFSRRNPVDDEVRYRARPEMHLAPRLADTGTLMATSINQIGGELAFQQDRFSVQGEYVAVMPSTITGADPTFTGAYVRASVFLTKDRRKFERNAAAYGRTRPSSNFLTQGEEKGAGAWELVAQYSTLDLTDQAVLGGELTNFSVGLNWYLNPNTRMMFDYVTSEIEGGERLSAIMTRMQVDF